MPLAGITSGRARGMPSTDDVARSTGDAAPWERSADIPVLDRAGHLIVGRRGSSTTTLGETSSWRVHAVRALR